MFKITKLVKIIYKKNEDVFICKINIRIANKIIVSNFVSCNSNSNSFP